VSFLTLVRVLFSILAFQLAVGLQPAIASAATEQSVHSSAEACPTHNQSGLDQAALKHDCCKSSGCQCHCGSLPLALNPAIARATLDDGARVRPAPATRAPSALPDTHFRPPIAS
jgi:hypothetical protein